MGQVVPGTGLPGSLPAPPPAGEDDGSVTTPTAATPTVAYVMSRFPKLSETFILYEILAVERRGVPVEVYPLLRDRPAVIHPEADQLVERAHYLPFLSLPILASQWHFLRRRPRAYLGALGRILWATRGSLNFLVGAAGIFPKVAHAARLMAESGVTHVHCHFANHPAVAGFVIRRLTGIPYSFTAHGSDLHVDRHMLREKVQEAEFVVAISKYNRDLIVSECGSAADGKVVVVHCGVDTSVFAPAASQSRGGPLSIVCVGTLHEIKGQAYLVGACRVLATRGIDFVCRLVGDGPDRSMLEDRIENAGLEGRVVIMGSLTRTEVASVLRDADVLVAPSVPTRKGKREGIPVVLMEGLAAGLAAVASDISGIPELIEHRCTGLLVPPGDAAALAEALTELAGDPGLRRELGRAGRTKVLREFDLETTAAILAERYAARVAA